MDTNYIHTQNEHKFYSMAIRNSKIVLLNERIFISRPIY